MSVMFKFHNKTTGKLMECNDLGYLLYVIRERHGLNISNDISFDDFILKDSLEYTVSDAESNSHNISIHLVRQEKVN